MAKVYLHNTILSDIANAIREKYTENRRAYIPGNFAKYILAIDKKPTGDPLVSTVTSQLVTVEDTTLTAIADAIRSKLNSTILYLPQDMASAIRSIPFSDEGETPVEPEPPTPDPDWNWTSDVSTAEWWAGLKEWLKTATTAQIEAKVGSVVSTPQGNMRCVHSSGRHLTFEYVYLYSGKVSWPTVKDSTVPITTEEIWNSSEVKVVCDSFYNNFIGKDSVTKVNKTFFLNGENIAIPVYVFIPSYTEYTGEKVKWFVNTVGGYIEENTGPQFSYYKSNPSEVNRQTKADAEGDFYNLHYSSYLVRSVGGVAVQVTAPVTSGSLVIRPARYRTEGRYVYRKGGLLVNADDCVWMTGHMYAPHECSIPLVFVI